MSEQNIKQTDWVDLGWEVSPATMTKFINANKVWQDGGLAFRRDSEGTVWALLGHTNKGGVTLWKGTGIDEMEMVGPVTYNFKIGLAGEAFNGTHYPSGPLSRGQLWPMGLWIDKGTGRFYCYIHNETGWGAAESAYTVHRQERGEPDFRNIGLMSSGDKGLSWDFEGWIIADEAVSYSEEYRPDGITEGGQKLDNICLGSGDFSMFANEKDGYLYIYYSQLCYSFVEGVKPSRPSAVCVARAPMETNGMPGSWMKYYDGSFSQPGQMGKADIVFTGLWPCVTYNTYLKKYIATGTNGTIVAGLSDDLVHWTDIKNIATDRDDIKNPYYTMIDPTGNADLQVTGKTFRVYTEHNGTDVRQFDVTIK
jgi:hypothetical protein